MKRFLHIAAAIVICCALLFCGPLAAAENAPSIRERKGMVPAGGTWIDRSTYVDGTQYENPPANVSTVRIGLNYGDTAVEEAVFVNSEGLGFRVGYYDRNRDFVEICTTDYDIVVIFWAEDPADGLAVSVGADRELLCFSEGEATMAVEAIDGETFYGGNCYRGGFDCCMTGNGKLIVVNSVGLEDYVKGVVPYEMAPAWPMEALKAQAVCARTYVVYNQNQYADYGFDLTDNTECQVYKGTDLANEWTDQAVDETAGQLIRYRGEICQIYYSAADGGATEDGAVVFNADRPYLLGKTDPFERYSDFLFRIWNEDRTGEEISDRLQLRGYYLGTVVKLEEERSENGNVIAITFRDAEGRHLRLEGRLCYTTLGLPSCRFDISQGPAGFHFHGSGLGHSCGMSQWGAKAMDEVFGFDYNDIIRFYFTGAYIA